MRKERTEPKIIYKNQKKTLEKSKYRPKVVKIKTWISNVKINNTGQNKLYCLGCSGLAGKWTFMAYGRERFSIGQLDKLYQRLSIHN